MLEEVAAEHGIPRIARVMASLPPDLFGFSPTSAFAIMASTQAVARLAGSRNSGLRSGPTQDLR
ncbi:MAG: hypothetical protein OK442_00110 [Thaumarchaeota archaeon]|nr:hypothetical protein [Nitrososphaerota archaeon]